MADSVPAPSARSDVAAVVLAAGAGARLRPLTDLVPKALCPVGNRPLVDLAIDAVASTTSAVAVNVHHGRDRLEPHLVARGDVHVSIEEPVALGTAGAVAQLRPWLDGRGALVVNADAWTVADFGSLLAGWDGTCVRILVAGDQPFGSRSAIVGSLLPAAVIAGLEVAPSGLWEACWRSRAGTDEIETVAYQGPFVDCGTPARYLDANRRAAQRSAGGAVAVGGRSGDRSAVPHHAAGSIVHPTARVAPGAVIEDSVIGAHATIEGRVRRSVVWPNNQVHAAEDLVDAVRADRRVTVLVR